MAAFRLSQLSRGSVMLKTLQLCDEVTSEDSVRSPTSCCSRQPASAWHAWPWWWYTATVTLEALALRGSRILSSAAWICFSATRALRSKVAIQRL